MDFVVTFASLSNKKEIKKLKANAKTIEDNLSNTHEKSPKLIEIEDRYRRNNLLIEGVKPFSPMFHFYTR